VFDVRWHGTENVSTTSLRRKQIETKGQLEQIIKLKSKRHMNNNKINRYLGINNFVQRHFV